tara:strand:+ start:11 stop:961 length:951 start_codon:yes stop_codon:yes gene_type:complete
MISVIIPILDEEENLKKLITRLNLVLKENQTSFEIIAVDDGSKDNSLKILKSLINEYEFLKVVTFKINQGQTAAIMAGIEYSSGEIIIPIDADLQNDPKDITKLLKKLNQGYDVVSGWRKNRKDSFFSRTLVSMIANWLISKVSGVKLHDYGCTLKAYRKEILENVKLYGEMHRFIPIYARWQGGKVTEIEVNHFPRISGKSKYGMSRIFKVILDIFVVTFLNKYFTKPIYIFGGFGLFLLMLCLISIIYMLYLKVFYQLSMIQTPLPMVIVMTFVSGILSILMGLLAEILVRTYFESQNKSSYKISKLINFKNKK